VSTYTIGEVAEASGFSTSALRYYERIGLVSPSSRSDAGYRVYDDRTLARLAFVRRAKQLGCSLEQITDLAGIWDGERCGPVQRRFHELITTKIGDAQRQIGEITALVAQLQTAASQLSGEPVDGPCGEGCACVSDPRPVEAVPVALSAVPADPPIACTLAGAAMPDRRAEWQAILAGARSRTHSSDGALRVELDDAIALAELSRLVMAEQECCAFLSFAITVDARGIALEVRAPDGAADVVATVLGVPA
jgi:DNA-binding transcriptional MerR regulator